MKVVVLIASSLLLLGYRQPKPNNSNESVRLIFSIWNKTTLESLKRQSENVNDSLTKTMLKNRLEVYQFTLYNSTISKHKLGSNDKSERYKFLEKINLNRLPLEKIFIVESHTLGEVHNAKNYLIKNYGDKFHVAIFNYYNNNWVKVKDTVTSTADLHGELIDSKRKYPSIDYDNCPDDVILTELSASGISSHFYIFGTIEHQNVLSKVLQL